MWRMVQIVCPQKKKKGEIKDSPERILVSHRSSSHSKNVEGLVWQSVEE